MALERESKYVSIGNMPYVAPQTGNVLSGVTDAIGDEIQKRQDQEDELATSELTASMFDFSTSMTNNIVYIALSIKVTKTTIKKFGANPHFIHCNITP